MKRAYGCESQSKKFRTSSEPIQFVFLSVGPIQVIKVALYSVASGVVSNLRSTPYSRAVVFTWSPPQDPNGVILSYEVTNRVNNSTSITTNTTNLSNMFVITSVTPFTKISDVVVSAYTRIGRGEGTPLEYISTLGEPCKQILLYSILSSCIHTTCPVSSMYMYIGTMCKLTV